MRRTSSRGHRFQPNRLYLALVSAGLLTGGVPLDALAANFTVNTVLDTADAVPGNGSAADSQGRTSLRAAIEEANALGGSHVISFHASLTSSANATVNLSLFDNGLGSGEYGPTAFMVENGVDLTLQGPSGDNGISIQRAIGSNTFRLFHVKPAATLTISNLAFANGHARGGSGSSRGAGGGGGAGLGGAIINEGVLQLEGVTLFGNVAEGGGGGYGNASSDGGGGGGGAGSSGSDASNTTGGAGGNPNGGANNSNGGTGGGGGGGNGRSAAGSQTGNPGGIGGSFGGGGGGGGVLATGGGSGTATAGAGGNGGFGGGGGGGGGVRSFNYTRIPGSGGSGGFGAGSGSGGGSDPSTQPKNGDGGGGMGAGGAIFNYGGGLSIRNATLSGNTAQGGSSGLILQYGSPGPAGAGGAGSGFGSAIFSTNRGGTSAAVNLRQVTVADNVNAAGQAGGAAGSAAGSVFVLGNAGTSTFTVNNTIIANTSGGNDFVAQTISGGTANSSGVGNLIESSTGFGGSITTAADPNLAGLANNRGPTPTRALNAGSPAVDSGNPGQTGGLSTDQRGGIFARVADGDLNGSAVVDIGAYELLQIDYGDAPDFASGTGNVEVLLENGTDDLRISVTGGDADASRSATTPRVAYNDSDNEYLVVWSSDATADNDFEIWGRRIDAETRSPVGGAFRISSAVAAGVQDAQTPDVAWSSTSNEYLVVWYADLLATDNEFEIFGRTVSASGALTGTQIRISSMGVDGDVNARADQPRVAYSPVNDEYLVVWRGDESTPPLVDNENEIFAQRINAASRNLVAGRMQVSAMAGANGDTNFDASDPSISRNANSNQFLVTWHGDDNAGGMVDNEQEVFGRFVTGGGSPQGSQFRISSMGGSGNPNFRANNPSSAFNPSSGQFMVVWHGDDSSLVDNELEIWGQRINGSTGANIGPMLQISDVGIPGDTMRIALNPSVVFSTATANWLVAYQGDEVIDNAFEILARRLSATGTPLDGDEVRLSSMGTSDSDTAFSGFNASMAFDSNAGDTLLVFQGDDDSGSLVDNHVEVYGQFLTDTPLVDYRTRGADNGPAHIRVAGMRLGAVTDNDPDGQPSLDADGDDLAGVDDEDSTDSLIEFESEAPALTVNVTNTSGGAATLYGWIDYDGDGIFENASERGSVAVPNGTNGANLLLTLPAPPPGPAINTFLRLRLSSDPQAANATGVVTGGEVEDYPAINSSKAIFADGFED
ncbi:MAG: choice-of-anchor Q domain-containing protein [Lysobacteraceae bacterium]